MSRNSSAFNKQNELIRSLRKQLEATERQLADQRWLFQQFMQSPSWRLTYPIRWVAKHVRSLRAWIQGTRGPTPRPQEPVLGDEESDPLSPEIEAPLELKQAFADLYRMQLQSFLTSGATLQLRTAILPKSR